MSSCKRNRLTRCEGAEPRRRLAEPALFRSMPGVRLLPALWLCFALCAVTLAPARTAAAQDHEREATVPGTATVPPAPDSPFKTFLNELVEGFSYRGNVLGFGFVQNPVESDLNRNNRLELAKYQTEWDLRPDFALRFRRLDLSVKPRFDLRWQKFKGSGNNGRFDEELYVNEWLVRLRATDELFASYGRENLQWGPSYLISPSNPFNPGNGENNPYLEVPGMGYGRMIWIPNSTWSVSYIVNTNEGRNDLIEDFEITYAGKIDYTGQGKYFSLIPFVRQGGDFGSGFFGGWNVTDALMLHSEGLLSTDRGNNYKILVGGSYTFSLGPTFVLEYFYQQNGCDFENVGRCFVRAAGGEAVAADVLVRQHYLLFQYFETDIWDVLDLSFRFIHNFDNNNSNTFVGVANYELLDWMELFSVMTFNTGVGNSEFASLVTYQVQAGVNFSF